MFGRIVEIEGREWFVFCTPETPMSEVLERAAQQASFQEKEQRENSPTYKEYRKWVEYVRSGHR